MAKNKLTKPRPGMFILVRYDLVPYALCHEITSVSNINKTFSAAGHWRFSDIGNDCVLLSREQGLCLEEDIQDIRDSYSHEEKRIKALAVSNLSQEIANWNISVPMTKKWKFLDV